ncbi:hypothetical protein V1498_11405 [Peribacillus sp. SCS-26]
MLVFFKGIMDEIITAVEMLLILSFPYLIYFYKHRSELFKKKD